VAKPKIRFLYTGIRVRDLERSIRFYEAMGMRIRTRGKMAHGGEFVHLGFPGSPVRLELNYYPKENKFYVPFGPGEEFDHLGFYAKDADAALAMLRRAGATVAIPTWNEPRSRIGYVRDPDGVTLEVFGPRKPRAQASRRRRASG
jgi:catechol 2,3-dioxygenase-like lactoylglutathione lyase family enzyme